MKSNLIKTALVILLIAFSSGYQTRCQEPVKPLVYEYASIRFMGGQRTCITWPDGTVEKLSSLSTQKRPETADERMFYLTIAVNILAKRGFEFTNVPMLGNPDDIFGRKLAKSN
jgi:hypothetical protein